MIDESKTPVTSRETIGRFAEFLVDVGGDGEQKESLMEDPRRFFSDKGIFVPADVEIQVHENTHDTFHLVFPPDPNEMLHDEALAAVAGGKTAGSAGTAGTLSCASTVTLSWSTASTAGTVGTMGCAS